MKVQLQSEISRGLQRITTALENYAPNWVEFVEEKPDLTIIIVNGRREHLESQVKRLKNPYALVQCVLYSTKSASPQDWMKLWDNAELVWSYYDLPIDYYRAPLGVGAEFTYDMVDKDYLIATSGLHRLTESVREVFLAAGSMKVAHLGDISLDRYPNVDKFYDITDIELSSIYNRSCYVSGLRRIEGFELPAAEGIICGARPIMFDKEHYRHWFDGLAIFIPEGDRSEVQESLYEIFQGYYSPVTDKQRQIAKERFNWNKIIGGFYERLAAHNR